MRNTKYPLLLGIGSLLVLLVVAVGSAQNTAVVSDEKQSKAEKAAVTDSSQASERMVSRIGVFPPGFDEQARAMFQEYEKEYGEGNVQTINHQGYLLIVPPTKAHLLYEVQQDVDRQIVSQKEHTPAVAQQKKEKAAIRRLFGAQGPLSFNPTMGVYADERGYQYVLHDGVIVSKSIGVTDSLRRRWEETHPVLKTPVPATAGASLLTEEQAGRLADSIVENVRTTDPDSALRVRERKAHRLGTTTGFDYGEVKILVDRKSGEVIHFSRDSREAGGLRK